MLYTFCLAQQRRAGLRRLSVCSVWGAGGRGWPDRTAGYVPVTFNAEGTGIRTTACLEVTNVSSRKRPGGKTPPSAPTRPNKRSSRIAAIRRKDSAALAKLADPTQGEGTKDFDDQSVAFFQQFDALKMVAVPRAYAFDGLLVFFPKLEAGSQSFFAPLVFARRKMDRFVSCRHGQKQPGLQILADWFNPNLDRGGQRAAIL